VFRFHHRDLLFFGVGAVTVYFASGLISKALFLVALGALGWGAWKWWNRPAPAIQPTR